MLRWLWPFSRGARRAATTTAPSPAPPRPLSPEEEIVRRKVQEMWADLDRQWLYPRQPPPRSPDPRFFPRLTPNPYLGPDSRTDRLLLQRRRHLTFLKDLRPPDRLWCPTSLDLELQHRRWKKYWGQISRLQWNPGALRRAWSSCQQTHTGGTPTATGGATPGTTTTRDWLLRTQPPPASPSGTGDGNSDFL